MQRTDHIGANGDQIKSLCLPHHEHESSSPWPRVWRKSGEPKSNPWSGMATTLPRSQSLWLLPLGVSQVRQFFFIKGFPCHIWDTHSTSFREGDKNVFVESVRKGRYSQNLQTFWKQNTLQIGGKGYPPTPQTHNPSKVGPKKRVMGWNMTHATTSCWFPSPNQTF